jgi:hypothetical protein
VSAALSARTLWSRRVFRFAAKAKSAAREPSSLQPAMATLPPTLSAPNTLSGVARPDGSDTHSTRWRLTTSPTLVRGFRFST